ncbi:MAG: HAMP domain-containing histidine kinase [Sphingobacteriales bacterium]|nr:MAG: HAMP domain-containing histidine kinase [Sphingobacteriales bacterium]
MHRYLNWKTILAVLALLIVATTLQYTNQLAGKLAAEEHRDVQSWAEAIKTLVSAKPDQDLSFALHINEQNTSIPVIQTDANNRVLYVQNIDTAGVRNPNVFLRRKLSEFSSIHPPILIDFGSNVNYLYYGESYLLRELRMFPYVQLLIILLFLGVLIFALTTAHRSIQNQVWVGLSKETAHQLGTPLTSMEGWVELLAMEQGEDHETVQEMRKDLERLKLVADRFSKVGSTPVLVEEDVNQRIEEMVLYMQKRAPESVQIQYQAMPQPVLIALNGPLFDWVLENLMRNALDAMDGSGRLSVQLKDHKTYIVIDVTDTGKGISQKNIRKVFKPGFSTKKRGWGLGLSLSKRIIEQYHKGTLRVKESTEGKGTTFRMQIWR